MTQYFIAEINLHVGWELAQRLVEVVHLRQNAHSRNNHEYVGRSVSELIVAGECQLQSNAECLDGHDRDGPHEGADAEVNKWVVFAIDRSDFVNHEDGECRNRDRIYQEAWAQVSQSGKNGSYVDAIVTYQVAAHRIR